MAKVLDFVKKNIVLCTCFVSFIILFVVMMSLGAFKKGTFSIDEEENQILINCPSTFSANETIECNVSLSLIDDVTIYSLNANYDFADGITYESFGVDNTECTGESCIELFESTENGFAVINTNGISGNINVGRLRVKMPSGVTPNTSYKVGLNNIELSYGENIEMVSLNNAFFNLRAKNNVAALSNLYITGYDFDREFDGEETGQTSAYKVTVPSNVTSVQINCEVVDPNSTVYIERLTYPTSIHDGCGSIDVNYYGYNDYTVHVVAEDGINTKGYDISVYREYDFSTDVYLYNEEKNYIYVGTDSDDLIISKLVPNVEGILYEIEFDDDGQTQLWISNGFAPFMAIDIIKFDINREVLNKKIYINNELTYETLLSDISIYDDFTVKLLDSNNEEVTDHSTIIDSSYHLHVYYDGDLLDSYDFSTEYLQIDDSLMVDDNTMMIKRLPVGTTVGTLLDKFETSGSIKVTSKGNDVSNDKKIKTGDKLIIVVGKSTITYTLSVLGDVTGDGMIDIDDVGKLYRYFRGKEQLASCYIAAGEITSDGMIDIDDVGKLYRYFRGKETSLEV